MQQQLKKILKSKLPTHSFNDVCAYLFNHPGKLFRSQLICALAKDLNLKNEDEILNLCAFIEIHHTYTLIHDDLPAMDDDDLRRGITSTHKKFDEASAILAGDALLIASFSCLVDLPKDLLRLCTWATGAKGLIAGQYFDLNQDKKTFEEVLRVHELKTARLFQICTLGCSLLSNHREKQFKDFMRLGQLIGLMFQIIDDFDDRDDLYLIDKKRAQNMLQSFTERFKSLCSKHGLHHTQKQIIDYAKSQSEMI